MGSKKEIATKILLLAEDHRADFTDSAYDFKFYGIRPFGILNALREGRGGSNIAMQISENIRYKPIPFGKKGDTSRPICILFYCTSRIDYSGTYKLFHNSITQKPVEFSDAIAIHNKLYDPDKKEVWERYEAIAEMYFSAVPFINSLSGSPHGLRTASWAVFNKKVDELTDAELLLLIGGAIKRPITARRISENQLSKVYWKYSGWLDIKEDCDKAIGIRFFADLAYRRVLKKLIIGQDKDLLEYAPFPVPEPIIVGSRKKITNKCLKNYNEIRKKYMSSLPNKPHSRCSQDSEAIEWRKRYGFKGQNGCKRLLELEKNLIDIVKKYKQKNWGEKFTNLPTVYDSISCGELQESSMATLTNPNKVFERVFVSEQSAVIKDLKYAQKNEINRTNERLNYTRITDIWLGLPSNHIKTRCAVKSQLKKDFSSNKFADFSTGKSNSVEIVLHVADLNGRTVFSYQKEGRDGPKLDKHINLASVSKILGMHYLIKKLCVDETSCLKIMEPGEISKDIKTSIKEIISKSDTEQFAKILKYVVSNTNDYSDINKFIAEIGHPYYRGKITENNLKKFFSTGQAHWLASFKNAESKLSGTTIEKHQAYMIKLGSLLFPSKRKLLDKNAQTGCNYPSLPRNILHYNLPNYSIDWRDPKNAKLFCGRPSVIVDDSNWFKFSPIQVSVFRTLLKQPLNGTAKTLKKINGVSILGVKTGTLEWGEKEDGTYSKNNRSRLISGFFEANNIIYSFTFYAGFTTNQRTNDFEPHLGNFGPNNWRNIIEKIAIGLKN